MRDRRLLDITFSPQSYTVSQIQEMVREGTITVHGIEDVFGKDRVDELLRLSPATPLPHGCWNEGPSDATQIIFWGVRGSGKTMAIASLLALDGMKPDKTFPAGLLSRFERLRSLFVPSDKPQLIPEDEGSGNSVESYPVVYQRHFWNQKYPILLTEVSIPATEPIHTMVQEDHDLVHLFCIDCRQDIHQQADRLIEVISWLEGEGHLSHTAGIYLLVTKTDLMNAPEEYRENTAQTLVISSLPTLWHKVQELCKTQFIYNGLPVGYSVGTFVLQDYARLQTTFAKQVFKEALLPKCQPRRTILGKLIGKGKKGYAFLLAILVIITAGYGAYKALDALNKPPQEELTVFDYRSDFLKETTAMNKESFDEACKTYRRLSNDLQQESSIRTTTGEPVLTDDERRSCDSSLVNTFAQVIGRYGRQLFSSIAWSRDESKLKELRRHVESLTEKPQLKEKTIRRYALYVENYFDEVKPMIERSQTCHDMDEVNTVIAQYEQWNKEPYTTDTLLARKITEVPHRAYLGYAQHLLSEATAQVNQYEQSWEDASLLEKPFIYFIDKSELKSNLREIRDAIDELSQQINNLPTEEYVDVVECMNQARQLMEEYI